LLIDFAAKVLVKMQSAAFQLPERKTKRKQNFAHSSAWHLVCKICLPFGRAKIAAPLLLVSGVS